MHPINEAQPYPFECWWVAAFSSEVGRKILGRTILGKRVILYRTEAGDPVALHGYCPHRSYPLEKGRLVGDSIQCGYHGLMFEADGRCSRIPSQPGAPGEVAVRRYPIVERGGVIWLWTGRAENADAALIPDTESVGLSMTGWKVNEYPMATIAARYTLMIDNLIDLSHISFIHAQSLARSVAELPVEIIETPTSVNARRIARQADVRLIFPHQEKPIDRCQDAWYLGPQMSRTGGWFRDSETGRELGSMIFISFITPETEMSHHYFALNSRNFNLASNELDDMMARLGQTVLAEDIEALELIERGYRTLNPAPSEVSCRADAGAMKVRQRLAQQIRSEIEARDGKEAAALVARP